MFGEFDVLEAVQRCADSGFIHQEPMWLVWIQKLFWGPVTSFGRAPKASFWASKKNGHGDRLIRFLNLKSVDLYLGLYKSEISDSEILDF